MSYAAHQLGHAGETAATDYFLAHGFTVDYQNYRYQRAEVDLIVRCGTELLIFVEVKTRSSSQFGYPETFVTERKRQLFRLAADQYQEEVNWQGDIRFDILALTPTNNGFQIEHFEDAFY
ncbi:YraN family protein [Hymenobacter crusticola]|uniref:UPF0102 protein BXP70_12435 n=1 Tax=Hymenobacter crusticola TaxID=1770526 RepID=A0A243WDM2_9BACT|nr:YraN family protein [Hymenobacter crusticola]OUJ73778.1 hypothetical protein BXP70_12435 [Hymenobacter crusticola]